MYENTGMNLVSITGNWNVQHGMPSYETDTSLQIF